MKRLGLLVAALPIALAAPAWSQGGGFTPGFDPPLAVDVNPDPDVFEMNLTAAPTTWQFEPGVDTDALAYNGTIPGPMIDVKVGDHLIVHFTNNLGEPTTVHWHGVDTPSDMDGSHIAQLWVEDGQTFTYEFDLLTPGLKWYHPHVRTDYMVEHGLYGALLVRDAVNDAALGIQGEEHVIMFDDAAIDPVSGQFESFLPDDPLERTIYWLSGRRGNVVLLNGKQSDVQTLVVPNGVPQRWWVVNVSNAQFTRLDLNEYYASLPAQYGDEPQLVSERWVGPVWKIGGDRGFIRRRTQRGAIFEVVGGPGSTSPDPHPTNFNDRVGILLVPGERMEVSFTPYGDPGEVLPVAQWDWPRGDHVAFYMPDGVTIGLADEPFDGFGDTLLYFDMVLSGRDPGPPYYEPPLSLVPPADELFPGQENRTVQVHLGHGNPTPAGDVTMFAQMVNGMPKPLPTITSVEAYDMEIGDVVLWEINNLSHGDHPFHTHGFPFQAYEVEQIDAVTPANNLIQSLNKEVKDTILVPQRPGAKGTSRTVVRALMHIDETGREGRVVAQGVHPSSATSGGWLFHCHILEHAKRGMMSMFEVRDPTVPFANLGGGKAAPDGTYAYLAATGAVTAGSPVTMSLRAASPNVPTFPIVGLSEGNLAVPGGVLVPFPDFVLPGFVTDGNGALDVPFSWPGVPQGASLWWQFWNLEPGPDFSASNTVRITQL